MLNIILEIYLLGSILFGILLWMTLVVAKKMITSRDMI